MPLCKSANCWIAGHLTDGIGIYCQKKRLATHSSCCQCSFNSSMASSNDNDFILLWINKHDLVQVKLYFAAKTESAEVFFIFRSRFEERCSQILKTNSISSGDLIPFAISPIKKA